VTETIDGTTVVGFNPIVLRGEKGEPGDRGDKGDPGPPGPAPHLTIGTVTTVAAGEDATVTITGTDDAPVFNFQIPHGPAGAAAGPSFVDNGDGTFTLTPGAGLVDNGDGTFTLS
jgi:hypothetical protein